VQWYRIAPHAQPPENSLGISLTIRYHRKRVVLAHGRPCTGTYRMGVT